MAGMQIGINASSVIVMGSPTSAIVEHARQAETDGFSSYWLAQLGAPDALTVLGAVGRSTDTIELGTAVISTWLRHPTMLAAQALTVSEMAGGRLVLGIGLAHKPTVEDTLRIPFTKPAQHMGEYLAVLLPLLAQRRVDTTGEIWSAKVDALGGPPSAVPSVMLAAMGPRMLDLAGSRTDGTILWLSGPTTIDRRIRPALEAAAERAGRTQPRIVASVPICVTDEAAPVRDAIAAILANYNDLPSYRSVMDEEGVDGPEDVSIIGDESHVSAELERFAAAGTTDFSALEFGLSDEDLARTRALLRSLA